MNRILVVGGTGRLGAPVARRLLAEGFDVRVLTRNETRARMLFAPDTELAVGDVGDPAALRAALDGCTGVHVSLAGGPLPADYDRVEHRGTAAVARAAAEQGVKLLTYLSGATVRAEHAGHPPTAAKLAAERAVHDSGVPFTVFRASWFMESLPAFVRGRRAVVPGRQRIPYRFLAAEDFAATVVAAHRTGAAAGRTLAVLGPQPLTIEEALARYCAIAEPGVRVSGVPLGLLRTVAALTRDAALADTVRSLRYFSTATEEGDPADLAALFDAPATDLETWARRRVDSGPTA